MVKIGLHICEDLWDDKYDIKVGEELCIKGAEYLVNISASPFHIDRFNERLSRLVLYGYSINKTY